ncbi:ABC transporter permease [Kurthia senegalensis]|uniref:ABC transporter permease n=1 Tax=Kurthia senegalensis TaxID=1033740 RepID=UPI0002892C61|nr:ABC transporter permease [Kurthia senegalensis]
MRTIIFANRVAKEIVRDPISLFFGLIFPLILLGLLSAINQSIPVDLFNIASLAPGIVVFGLSFMAFFAAQIVSKDRATLFLARLYTTPMTASNFIFGYIAPLLVMALIQGVVTLLVAVPMGLSLSIHMLTLLVAIMPIALFYIAFGIVSGTLFSEKAAVAICGAILTNVSAWLSGIWFDLNLVGGTFKEIAYMLPFVHAVEMAKAAMAGEMTMIFPHMWWVLGYTIVITLLAIFVFQFKKEK